MNYELCFVTPDGADDTLILAAIEGGATMIQLRDKSASDAEIAAQAKRILPICRENGVPLIINDRLEVALATDADGLHIGQSDGDPSAIKSQLHNGQILGLSIHDHAQLSATPRCVDYIGIGPVFSTSSKSDAEEPIGTDGLALLVEKSPVPTIAIGGITLTNLTSVKLARPNGVAVISAISQATNPMTAARELITKWRHA